MADKTFNILTVFSANTKPFLGALGSVYRQLTVLSFTSERLGAAFAKASIPFLAAGAAMRSYLVGGVRDARAYANGIADLSDRLGVSAEFLQKWHYIARQNASSAEDVNGALSRLAKQCGALKAGTGSLYAGLAKISPEFLKQIRNAKGVEEVFSLMTKAIRKVEDPAKKAYLAELAFGEAGRSLIASASLSDEELAKLTASAKAGGLIIGNDLCRACQQLGDSMANLSQHVRGVFGELAGKLSPILQSFVDRLTKWIIANRALLSTKIDDFIKRLGSFLSRIDFDKVLNGLGQFISFCDKIVCALAQLNPWIWAVVFAIGTGLVSNFLLFFSSLCRLLSVFPGVTAACGLLKGALVKLGAVLLTTPLGWAIMAFAAVAGGIIYLWNKCEGFRNFWKDLWRSITGEAETGVGRILKFLCRLNPIVAAMDGVKDLWNAGKAVANKISPPPPHIEWGQPSAEPLQFNRIPVVPNNDHLPASLRSMTVPPVFASEARQSLGADAISPSLSMPASQPTRSEVTVKFMGLPKNAVVEQKTSGDAVDLGVEYGYSMADV